MRCPHRPHAACLPRRYIELVCSQRTLDSRADPKRGPRDADELEAFIRRDAHDRLPQERDDALDAALPLSPRCGRLHRRPRGACVGRPGGAVMHLPETLASPGRKQACAPDRSALSQIVRSERELRTGLAPASVGKEQPACPRPSRRATAPIRPTQQPADARASAPTQLLCREAGVSPCAPARRPGREPAGSRW